MTRKHLTLKEQLVGFPLGQVLVIGLVRFAEPIAFTQLFPYIYFMVRDFGVAKSDDKISTYSGILSASFSLAQVFTGIFWGRMSDKHGRKPILIIGMLGNSITMLMFGFSKSFAAAMFARSLQGVLNGNVGVMRSVLGEVAKERKHEALAFSTMPLLWQIGSTIGPMVGGFLSNPAAHHPEWWVSSLPVFQNHPYALPNVVVACLILFSTLIAVLFLKESHPRFENCRDPGIILGTKIKAFVANAVRRKKQTERNTERTPRLPQEQRPLLIVSHDENQTEYSEESRAQDDGSDVSEIVSISRDSQEDESVSESHKLTRYNTQLSQLSEMPREEWGRMLTPKVLDALFGNFILALHTVVFDEFFPVLFSVPVAKDDNGKLISHFPFVLAGGLNLTSALIGKLLSVNGAIGMVCMIFLFPTIERIYGILRPYQTSVILYSFLYLIFPYLILLGGARKEVQYGFTFLLLAVKTILSTLGFPCVMLLINRSVDEKSYLGSVNGLAQMISASARFIGPLGFGFVMAWSQEIEFVQLTYWVMALLCLGAFFHSFRIKEEVEADVEARGELTEEEEEDITDQAILNS